MYLINADRNVCVPFAGADKAIAKANTNAVGAEAKADVKAVVGK